jgi:hypothetical protein
MELQGIGNGVQDGPEESHLREESLDTTETRATSKRWGGIDFDQEQGQYPLEWDDLADFEAWHQEEELAYTIKIISSSTYHGGPRSLWLSHRVFVCRCEYPGGKPKYERKVSHLDLTCHLTNELSMGLCSGLVVGFPPTRCSSQSPTLS